MSTTAHVFVILVTIGTVGFIIWLVRQHRLKSKFSLLWLAIGLVLLVLAAFPNLLDRVSHAIGIEYPPATFLFAAVAFLFLVAVHYSWELSRLEERSRVLAEEAALLRESVERLEDRLASSGIADQRPDREAQASDGTPPSTPEEPSA
jgi:hypothetical protein